MRSPVLDQKRSEYIQHTLPSLRIIVAYLVLAEYILLEPLKHQLLLMLLIVTCYATLCFFVKRIKVFFGKYQYVMLLLDQLAIFLLCYTAGGLSSPLAYGFVLPVLIFSSGPTYRQLLNVLLITAAWLTALGLLTGFHFPAFIYITTMIILTGIFVHVTVSNDMSIFTRYAIRDGLTGLYTQRYFYEHLDILINHPAANIKSFGLVMIDLDDFKRLNDKLGHVEGDRILKDIAETIKRTVRDTDVVARYGGDEFAIILPGVEYQLCQVIVERLRSAIVSMDYFDNVSIGSALYPDESTQIHQLVTLADARMYQQKRRTKQDQESAHDIATDKPC